MEEGRENRWDGEDLMGKVKGDESGFGGKVGVGEKGGGGFGIAL